MDKLTQSSVDALYAKGLSIKQIAGLYGCSESRIATLKSKNSHGIWRGDQVTMDPIKPIEIQAAKQVKAGHRVKVLNLRRPRGGIKWGVWEWERVVKKYPHIAVLDNGWTDYLPDTMSRMLGGCLFFRKEPAMEVWDGLDEGRVVKPESQEGKEAAGW